MRNNFQYRRRRPKNRFISFIKAAPALAVLIAAGGAAGLQTAGDLLEVSTTASCEIKGNISINTGERIYHVPGQEFYSQTRISPQHGERWFCTEAEARSAGWRKARI